MFKNVEKKIIIHMASLADPPAFVTVTMPVSASPAKEKPRKNWRSQVREGDFVSLMNLWSTQLNQLYLRIMERKAHFLKNKQTW